MRRSESSLYAKYDHASATTMPYSVTHTVLNYTGGDAWRSSGQWIEWDTYVPEDGYYYITIKGRQNYARGSVSSRILYIDGELGEEKSYNINNSNNYITYGDSYEFNRKTGKIKSEIQRE